MAIPSSTFVFAESLDPYDFDHFTLKTTGLLDTGEDVAKWQVDILSESLLFGLKLGTGQFGSYLLNKEITIWLEIDADMQGNPAFFNGVTLPMVLSITTSTGRRRQRTFALRVIEK